MSSVWAPKVLAIVLIAGLTGAVYAASKGPDPSGYTASDQTVFSFVDVSGSGGGTGVLAGVDDGTALLTLPFTFHFYGASYGSVCVSSNGALYFTSSASACAGITDFANVDLSAATTPSDLPAVLPFWTDLSFAVPGAGSLYYAGFGTPGNRRFVIQWANAYAATSTSPVTFEVVLFEGTNSVSMQYQTVALGNGDPANNGGTATVGIHNTGGLGSGQQIQWSYNVPVLANNYAIVDQTSAAPAAPVLVSPLNGATNVSTSVTLSWNAANSATSYDVYFGPAATPPIAASGTTSLTYSPSGLAAGTTYYWQIVAKNDAGSAASAVYSFTTAGSSGNGGGGSGEGGGGGGQPLTLNPASVTLNATAGGPAVTQTVTLSDQTFTQGAPTFSDNSTVNQGHGWLSAYPASGTMTQTSLDGLLYTYSATITVRADPFGISGGSSYTGVVNLTSAGAIISLPVTFNVSTTPAPQPTGGIANAASAGQAAASLVAPGSYIAIYGSGLAGTGNPNAATLPLPTTLNGAQVTLCGTPMPLLYASATQINAIVPQSTTGTNSSCSLVVTIGSTSSAPVPLTVTELQPGIYTVNESGSGPGVVADALTGTLNSASSPAHANDKLVIYATGLGAVTGQNGEAAPADGAAAPLTTIYHTTSRVTVTVGGVSVPASFSGLTPTLAGLYQVNFQIPSGISPGSAVPLTITATDPAAHVTATSNEVTIVVQ